jgi:hypothetical protein
MSRLRLIAVPILLTLAVLILTGFGHDVPFWSQWGSNAQHTGRVYIHGQPLNQKIADIVYDPFVPQEKVENAPIFGEPVLSAHYQSTLIEGDSFFMVQKTGTYISCTQTGGWFFGEACGPNTWHTMEWNVARYDWRNGQPVRAWMFPTGWKPPRNASNLRKFYSGLVGWEPVFHPALSRGHLYVPGAAGTVWKVDTNTGKADTRIDPFAGMSIDRSQTYVASPLTASDSGDIYYNVIQLSSDPDPWQGTDIAGAWLVRIRSDGSSSTVTYATLVPDAPAGNSFNCAGTFYFVFPTPAFPWPPASPATPPTTLCGSQRPPLNLAPAIGPDGTVYTASMAHFDNVTTYLVAVNPDLTPKWDSSMQNRLADGCGVLLPIAPQGVTNLPNSCSFGATVGVDPTTNAKGSGYLSDQASSTPTVLPDGSIVLGVTDDYNFGRGHLMHFDAQGNYLNAYTFGWDSTAAVYEHDNTYSLVIKDNHYPEAAYCFDPTNPVCTAITPVYYVSQVDANMSVEWSFQSTTINKDHPNGYEWCVNAPVVDRDGIVYVTSEDGHVYSIPQGHKGVFTKPRQKIFLLEALGAAYTPMSIGEDGREYSQNDGHLFVVGAHK